MKQYLDLLNHVIDNGVDRMDRTGTGTRGVFGYQMRFNLSDGFPMVTLEQLQEARDQGGLESFLLPVDVGLAEWPKVVLNTNQQGKFIHGNHFPFSDDDLAVGKVRVYGPGGGLLGLGDLSADQILQPARVFNL